MFARYQFGDYLKRKEINYDNSGIELTMRPPLLLYSKDGGEAF